MYVSDLIRPNFLSIISFLSDLTSKLQCCHKNTSKFRLGKEKRKPLPSCSTHTRGLFCEMFQLFSPSREIPHIGWPSPSWWSYLQIEFKANKYCKLLLKYQIFNEICKPCASTSALILLGVTPLERISKILWRQNEIQHQNSSFHSYQV